MFNGIINFTGKVSRIVFKNNGSDLFIKSNIRFNKSDIGSSVSCDGVCLTLVSFKNNYSRFYLSNETLLRSKFKFLKIGDKINIEKAIKFGQKISGHFVQGHVDTIGKIRKIKKIHRSWILEIYITNKIHNLLIEKASICINGVSLTISKLIKKSFQVSIIPHTLKLTNLLLLKKNDLVNIEIDVLSKYVKKFIYEKK